MQRSLQALSNQVKGSHKAVSTRPRSTKAFDGLHRSVREVGERVRGALNPAMAGVRGQRGISGGRYRGRGSGSEGLRRQLPSFSDLSKEVGLSVQQLRVWEALAERVGSSAEAMDSGLQGFAASLEQLRRNRGDLSVWLQSFDPTSGGDRARHA